MYFNVKRGAEGIDVAGDQLFFVSKEFKTMFVLDLVTNTYSNHTTRDAPLLEGQPDQIERLFDPLDNTTSNLYFTQDGGRYAGISAVNSKGQCFTVLESHVYSDETTGLAFSPGKCCVVAANGIDDVHSLILAFVVTLRPRRFPSILCLSRRRVSI